MEKEVCVVCKVLFSLCQVQLLAPCGDPVTNFIIKDFQCAHLMPIWYEKYIRIVIHCIWKYNVAFGDGVCYTAKYTLNI